MSFSRKPSAIKHTLGMGGLSPILISELFKRVYTKYNSADKIKVRCELGYPTFHSFHKEIAICRSTMSQHGILYMNRLIEHIMKYRQIPMNYAIVNRLVKFLNNDMYYLKTIMDEEDLIKYVTSIAAILIPKNG